MIKLRVEEDSLDSPGGQPRAAPAESTGKDGITGFIRRIPPEVPIFLFFVALSIFLTWPVIKDFGHNAYGFPSDNLGTMWNWWWFRNASSFGARQSLCPLIGFPFGQPISVVTFEFLIDAFARFMMLFTSQVVVNNLITTTSFALSGVTMYYLVRYITRSRMAAWFGGLAFLVGAYHAVHAMMFPSLAMTQWMPLYILALLFFLSRPTPRNALLLFLSAILLVGTSIHYGLFMAVFTVTFLVGRFLYARLRSWRGSRQGTLEEGRPVRVNRKTLVLVLSIILGIVLVVLPIFFANISSANREGNWSTRATAGVVRSLETASAGSASPLAYLLPEKENFLLGWITSDYASSRVNSYENSLYLGLTVVGLAIFALAAALLSWKRKRRPAEGSLPDVPFAPQGEPAGDIGSSGTMGIVWGLVLSAVVAFVFSMPPYVYIGSTRLPLPSMIFRFTVPWFRWYMRFGVVVIICFILLASIGLSHLLRRRSRAASIIILSLLSAFLFLEMVLVPPFKYFTLDDAAPGVFKRIAAMDSVTSQVIYPAFDPSWFSTQRYLYTQISTRKAMLNGGADFSDGEALRRTVYNPFNPETPGILSRFGITHVVYLDRLFEQYWGKQDGASRMPAGMELVEQVKDDDLFGSGFIFRVSSAKAGFVPIYQGDITVPQIDEGTKTVRLMESAGIIKILNYTGSSAEVRIRIPVSNLSSRHQIAVLDTESVLWSGTLSGDESTVIDIPRVAIPKEGLDLGLSVTGARYRLDGSEAQLFGTAEATVRLGDVSITGPGGT